VRVRIRYFIAGGVVLYVVPNIIAVWLHERNMRKQP
jgi:hypothetical protein